MSIQFSRSLENEIIGALETIIDNNMKEFLEHVAYAFDIDDVFPEDKIKRYVAKQYLPKDIFTDAELEDWAKNNGFVKEE